MGDLMDRLPVGHADEPLSQLVISRPDVTASLRPREGYILLRGADTEGFRKKAGTALTVSLPATPGCFESTDKMTAIWRRPGGWLILCDGGNTGSLLDVLRNGLQDVPHLALDVSHQYVTIRISGKGARAALAKCCTLDLREGKFDIGHSARTLLGDVPMIIMQTKDDPCFELIVDQSLARFVWWWLQDLLKLS